MYHLRLWRRLARLILGKKRASDWPECGCKGWPPLLVSLVGCAHLESPGGTIPDLLPSHWHRCLLGRVWTSWKALGLWVLGAVAPRVLVRFAAVLGSVAETLVSQCPPSLSSLTIELPFPPGHMGTCGGLHSPALLAAAVAMSPRGS